MPMTETDASEAERHARRRTIALRFGIAVVVVAVLALATLPLISFFGDPQRVTAFISSAGPWGPIVFILIQIGQVFAAPIPGQVTGFVGGFLFGGFLGSVYATIGGTIGCALVFFLSRKLGRPFVERFVSTKILNRFDFLTETNGIWVLLFIFVVPIFPDDLICYVAGLTRIPLSRLVAVAFVGRIPGYVAFSLTGAGAAQSNITLLIVIAVIIVLAAGIAFWQRARIEAFLRRLSAPPKGPTNPA